MQTKIIGGGQNQTPGSELAVDPQFNALRVTERPQDFTVGGGVAGGAFRATLAFSNTAAAAGPLASLRWTDTNHYFLLKRIQVSGGIATVFTTAQVLDLIAQIARGYTVTDTGGTENVPFGANMQKNRSNGMNASLLNSLRNANTAITAGTRTLDTLPFAGATLSVPTATLGAGSVLTDLYKYDTRSQYPIVLAANEGIVISPSTALGAAGVVKWQFTFEWDEVPQF